MIVTCTLAVYLTIVGCKCMIRLTWAFGVHSLSALGYREPVGSLWLLTLKIRDLNLSLSDNFAARMGLANTGLVYWTYKFHPIQIPHWYGNT
jgi:hypothetical protein